MSTVVFLSYYILKDCWNYLIFEFIFIKNIKNILFFSCFCTLVGNTTSNFLLETLWAWFFTNLIFIFTMYFCVFIHPSFYLDIFDWWTKSSTVSFSSPANFTGTTVCLLAPGNWNVFQFEATPPQLCAWPTFQVHCLLPFTVQQAASTGVTNSDWMADNICIPCRLSPLSDPLP